MANNIIQVTLTGATTTGGVKIVNTWHYDQNPTIGTPGMVSFLANFISSVGVALLDILSTQYNGVEAKAIVVEGPDKGAYAIDSSWVAQAGSVGGTAEDFVFAYLVHRRGILSNRHSRGRLFIAPVINTTFSEDGVVAVQPSALNPFLTACDASISDIGGNSFLPCLFDTVNKLPLGPIFHTGSSRAGVRRHRRRPL